MSSTAAEISSTISALYPPPAPDMSVTPSRSSRSRSHLYILLLLTIVGGVIRFTKLDQPSIWGDESNTYSRVCNDFGELLTLLERDGFAPLHYELDWWIGQHHQLTPATLRLVPALA